MTQINMPAQHIKALLSKTENQVRFFSDKVILTLRESKHSSITLIGHIDTNKHVIDMDATLIEQHYSGDDQLSFISTDKDELINYLNNQLSAGNEVDQFSDDISEPLTTKLVRLATQLLVVIVTAIALGAISNITGCTTYVLKQADKDIATTTVAPVENMQRQIEFKAVGTPAKL